MGIKKIEYVKVKAIDDFGTVGNFDAIATIVYKINEIVDVLNSYAYQPTLTYEEVTGRAPWDTTDKEGADGK